MISFPDGASSGLSIVTRDSDQRSEQQKIFDQLRAEAMADANAAYEAKDRALAGQSASFKSQIVKSGFMQFAIDVQDISDLMGMLQLMRHEYPDMGGIISQVEESAYHNPPADAQSLRDLFTNLIRRDESLSPEDMQRAHKMMQRMNELLMMPDGLLELLDKRDKAKEIE